MDTSGPVPLLLDSDGPAALPQFTTELTKKLTARAKCALAQNVNAVGESPMATRNANLTTIQARVTRSASATLNLFTLPAGFRPSRQVFVPALKNLSGAVAFLQIDPNGTVSTPFESTAAEYLIAVTYANQEA